MANITEYEIVDAYNDMLDDAFGLVSVAGYLYKTSRLLKEVDPIAWKVGLSNYSSDYLCSQCDETIEGCECEN